MVAIIATIHCAVDNGEKDYKKKTTFQKIFTGWGFKITSALFWFGSLIAAVGGITMQSSEYIATAFAIQTLRPGGILTISIQPST
jgi:hypothetical protein